MLDKVKDLRWLYRVSLILRSLIHTMQVIKLYLSIVRATVEAVANSWMTADCASLDNSGTYQTSGDIPKFGWSAHNDQWL